MLKKAHWHSLLKTGIAALCAFSVFTVQPLFWSLSTHVTFEKILTPTIAYAGGGGGDGGGGDGGGGGDDGGIGSGGDDASSGDAGFSGSGYGDSGLGGGDAGAAASGDAGVSGSAGESAAGTGMGGGDAGAAASGDVGVSGSAYDAAASAEWGGETDSALSAAYSGYDLGALSGFDLGNLGVSTDEGIGLDEAAHQDGLNDLAGVSIGVGWADAVGFALSMALGPVGTALGIGLSWAASALGINSGVNFGVGSLGAYAYTSGNVQGGLIGAAMGAMGISSADIGNALGVSGESVSGIGDALSDAGISLSSSPSSLSSSVFDGGGESGGEAAVPGSPGVQTLQINNIGVNSSSLNGPEGCPAGYYFIAEANHCIPNSYISCASAGYPDLACFSGETCGGNGECLPSAGACSGLSGTVCTSSANSCGMRGAAYQCDNSCPAVIPADTLCPTPVIVMTSIPSLINPGDNCTVGWTVVNATACSLSSDVPSDAGLPMDIALPSGNYVSPALTKQRTYSLSCHDGVTVTAQASIVCHLNPQFQQN